jgi:hypothetical protein
MKKPVHENRKKKVHLPKMTAKDFRGDVKKTYPSYDATYVQV